MKLSNFVTVRSSYTRSVNLERDLGSRNVSRPYVPTSRALQTVSRVLDTLDESPTCRSWALIGPYGSGKSAFGLFLSNLLGNPSHRAVQAARSELASASEETRKRLDDAMAESVGLCVITATGSPEPLVLRFARALCAAAEEFLRPKRGRGYRFVRDLRLAIDQDDVTVSNLVGWLGDLQSAVAKNGGRGVLIVIDELGKFLEYEARHRNGTDIYLLQAIAEHAAEGSRAPLLLVVMLHQAFEQYFAGLGGQLKNEWKKIQGRFESVPYLETTEQVLRIVRSAISSEFSPLAVKRISASSARAAKAILHAGAAPPGVAEQDLSDIFRGAFPLHPVALLMLPVLCQRVAQNERTLFSYLGSSEPHGFQSSLDTIEMSDGTSLPHVLPWEIYEYFVLSEPGLVTDQSTHRRWAEVVTAVERLGEPVGPVARLLKTIGVLNIAGAQGGLKASKELLELCYEPNADGLSVEFEAALATLLDRSIITLRKFNGEYRVWQGSDFDLESALAEQMQQLGHVEVAQLLNDRQALSVVVGRRHVIQTGAVRHLRPMFVGAPNGLAKYIGEQPVVLVCLAESKEAETKFISDLSKLRGVPQVIAVVLSDGQLLRSAVLEVIALERIQRASPELASDPIAMRELRDRLAIALDREDRLLKSVLDEPSTSAWWWKGKQYTAVTKRRLQELMSLVLDETYRFTPRIHNELINADRPSSTAIAARNKLVNAMLVSSHEEDLGIEKFPAEKAMYRSVLRATGLHVATGESWAFGDPPANETNLHHTWDAIEEHLKSSEIEPLLVSSLYDALSAPPYGLKRGLLPILLMALLVARSDEIGIFESGQFSPFLTKDLVERIIKAPWTFSIQRFRTDQRKEQLFRIYIEASAPLADVPRRLNLVAAAKPLAQFLMNLPDFSKRTRSVSLAAQTIREAFFASKSPSQLLFYRIPEALGYSELMSAVNDEDMIASFRRDLQAALLELRVAYHRVLDRLHTQIKHTFYLDKHLPLHDVRDRLKGRFSGLADYTIDVQGLRAFIGRLTDPHGDETQWLVSLGSFLARKPPEKWTDDDVAAAEYRLVEFTKRLRDVETLRVHYERRTDAPRDLELILLKSISQTRGESELLVAMDASSRAAVEDVRSRIVTALGALDNSELAKAALALVVEQLSGAERLDVRHDVDATESHGGDAHA
jgi:hypothetical protein